MKPRIGISSCLLGKRLRYDGAHALDPYLRRTFSRHVEWIPVCPETECGLGVPREPMNLRGESSAPRLVTVSTGKDLTERMRRWSEKRLRELEGERLCGFLFKSGSPSCGLRGVKVRGWKGGLLTRGSGVFSKAVARRFPLLPMGDELSMRDSVTREAFIERIFMLARWEDFLGNGASLQGLKEFHDSHELLLASHGGDETAVMRRLISRAGSMTRMRLFERYHSLLMKTLDREATAAKNAKVLGLIFDRLKSGLSETERGPLLSVIEDYREGRVPLLVAVVAFTHYVHRSKDPYLSRQVFLDPYPSELGMRARS
jgi:uncharacterized protein YbbK (DUF523 family)/uncharacterized protein YbgA (DUF1722 family)